MLEDDYDSEFRYDVAPVPALATLDRDRVAYLGTASSRSPRACGWAGWCRRPTCSTRSTGAGAVTHDAAPWPVQRAFLSLLRDGYVDKVVRSARRVYADRAPRVAAALAPYAEPAGPLAGMYSTWLLPQADAVRRPGRRPGGRLRGEPARGLLPLRAPDRPGGRLRRLSPTTSSTAALGRARRRARLSPPRPRPVARRPACASNAAYAAARSRSILRPRKYAVPHSSAKTAPSKNISGTTKPSAIAATWTAHPTA